jgi:CHASE3 domain sensor protein
MSISKKLYLNFGAILFGVVALFAVILWAVHHEQSTKAAVKQALDMSDTTNHIQYQVMQNRLYLGNYLLSGDSREVEHMTDGVRQLTEDLQNALKLSTTDQQRSGLEAASKNESAWVTEFAQPMLQKRREVDAGNATVADLQIYYLQKDYGRSESRRRRNQAHS